MPSTVSTPLVFFGSPFESSRPKAVGPVERLQARKPRGPSRRSCDFCFTRKKKCDGDGFNHCSYCVSKGQVTCTYNGSRKANVRLGQKHLVTKGTTERGALKHAGSSLRRCRMGASMATGLVGTEENDLLRDFFDCMSYMPLTSPSEIRGAIMNITSFGSENQTFGHYEVADDGMITLASSGVDDDDDHTRLATTARVSSNAMVCIFWCAVAMGGMLQGRSESLIARYLRRAEDALSLCQGVAVAETVRALGLMAVLYAFLERDKDELKTCLEHRLKIIEELDPEESKQFLVEGFELYVHQPTSVDETMRQVEDTAAHFAPLNTTPRLPVLKMNNLSEENVYFHIVELATGLLGNIVRATMAANVTRPVPGTEHDAGIQGPDSLRSSDGVDPIQLSNVWRQDSLPARYEALRHFIRCNMSAIQRLRQANLSLRSLIGASRSTSPTRGLGVAVPSQIILALVSMAMGDREAVIEAIYSGAEGLARHPGLGRFVPHHMLYTIITLVCASLGDHVTYYKITDDFHSLGMAGMARYPSLEKRLEEFIPCGHTFCRIAEQFIRDHGWGPVLMSDSPECPGDCGSGDQSMPTAVPNGSETLTAMGVTACHAPDSPALHEEGTSLCVTDVDSSVRTVDNTRYHQQPSGVAIDEEDWGFIAATLAACAPDSPGLFRV